MAVSYYPRNEDPALIYYNLSVINGKSVDEGSNTNPPARFTETRDQPILSDASKYYMSIVRATLNGTDKWTPLFIPRIVLNQPNRNLTIYTIRLRAQVSFVKAGVQYPYQLFDSGEVPIIWSPQITTATLQTTGLDTQDFNSEYYWCMSYDHLINLVNTTYQTAWNTINSLATTYWGTLPGAGVYPGLLTTPPRMSYSPDTKRFTIYYDNQGFGWATGDSRAVVPVSPATAQGERWNAFANSNFYGLFSYFPTNYLGGDTASLNTIGQQGACWEYLVYNKQPFTNLYRPPNIASITTANTPQFWEMEQSIVSTSTLMSPVENITFTTTLIPVINEKVSAPIQLGQGNAVQPASGLAEFSPIITDISIPQTSAEGYNEYTAYIPTAEYRLADMTNSPTDIKSIDVSVFWKCRLDGRLYPVKMYNQATFSLKILFRRKDY
jgi:hypothetical protein